MSENAKKPRIRFKGFTDAWEQREFGYYFFERNERSGNGEMISVTINSGIRKFSELNRHDTKPDDLSKYKKVEVGDIAYNSMRMWQGASGYSPYSGILSPAYTVISPKNGVSSRFFSYVLKQPRMIHLFEINSQGLTKDTWNLKYPAFAPIETVAPKTYEEQEKISGVLVKIDELITLHQCKYFKKIRNKMLGVDVKKACSKTTTWEQRKLGDVAVKVTEKNTQNRIKETFTNSAEMGVISQRDFFDHDIAKADKIDGYYIVQENDFIYNPRISVTAPCGPINRNKLGRNGVMSPLYTVFRTNNINPLFLEWYFKSSCWYAYMYFNGDSGARSDRFSIKSELFFDMPIPSPKKDEQGRVGLLLETVNKLITLHQRE